MRAERGIRLTQRDLQAFRWLADMKAVWEDDLGVLLGRLNNREPLARPTTRAMVDRWRRHGLAEARKPLADRPRVVSLLSDGAAAAGQEGAWHDVALWTAVHTAEVSHVRLALEAMYGDRIQEWQAERRLRQELGGRVKGKALPHLPDGVVLTTDGQRWAVEVERSDKTSSRLRDIVRTLTSAYDLTIYATQDKAIGERVQRAYQAVKEDQSMSRPIRTNPLQVWNYPRELGR